MILYVGASLYHILCFSIHKLLQHPEEKAVLVIGDNIFSKSGMKELKEDLTESGIFERVEILRFIEGAYNNPYILKEDSPEEQIERYVIWNEQWVEKWLEMKKLDLSKVTEFNSAIDHRHLGMYILSKNFPYQYFEDGNGLLSRENVQLEFHKKAQYASYAVTKYLHALGNSENVTKKYANKSAQLPGFYDEKMEDFHVIKLFPMLSKQWQETILRMFHIEKIKMKEGTQPVLYLTRYVKYLQNPTIENHHFISAMVLDLFAEHHPVIIKPHPRDFSGRYGEIFPDAIVLDKHFPSELLPFIYDGRYEKIITIGSTAIDALADFTDQIIKLDVEFENKIDCIYQYVGALFMIQKTFPGISPEDIGAAGCLKEFLDPLCQEFFGFQIPEINFENTRNARYKVILADDITGPLPKADCVCYLNTKQDYYFADVVPNVFERIQCLNISVRPREKNCYGKKQESVIFIESQIPEIREQVQYFYQEKIFPYTGAAMFIGTAGKEKKEYIKLLSEILWIQHQKERKKEEKIFLVMPKIKRKIFKNDIKSLQELLTAVKTQGKDEYEDNSICTNEIKQ